MKPSLLLAALLICNTACSSQEQYTADRADATCAVWERCQLLGVIGYDSYGECFDELSDEAVEAEAVSGCADYDSAAAARCVDDLNAMECDSNFETPDSCFDVCG